MRAALLGPAACGPGLSAPAADARVARGYLDRQGVVADDQPLGIPCASGNFSRRQRFEVERDNEREARVFDLALGPRNVRGHLRQRFGPGWRRPSKTLEMANDLSDLAWLDKAFAVRTSAACGISTPDGARVPGCPHVFPSRHPDHDAEAHHRSRHAGDAGIPEDRLDTDSRSGPGKARPVTGPSLRGPDVPWTERSLRQ